MTFASHLLACLPTTNAGSVLDHAAAAVALACYGRCFHYSKAVALSHRRCADAIAATKEAVAHPKHSRSKQLLLAVMLLGGYEVRTAMCHIWTRSSRDILTLLEPDRHPPIRGRGTQLSIHAKLAALRRCTCHSSPPAAIRTLRQVREVSGSKSPKNDGTTALALVSIEVDQRRYASPSNKRFPFQIGCKMAKGLESTA